MGKITFKRNEKIVIDWLKAFINERNGNANTQYQLLIDKSTHQYQVLRMSWDTPNELDISIVFLFEIKQDGKIWILANNTDISIAYELMISGVSNRQIVLGFYSAALRELSEFAVA
jgi:XisI protein